MEWLIIGIELLLASIAIALVIRQMIKNGGVFDKDEN